LISNGEPFRLSPTDTKLISAEKRRFPSHVRCILTTIDGLFLQRITIKEKDEQICDYI